jgi:hypothetical protein
MIEDGENNRGRMKEHKLSIYTYFIASFGFKDDAFGIGIGIGMTFDWLIGCSA